MIEQPKLLQKFQDKIQLLQELTEIIHQYNELNQDCNLKHATIKKHEQRIHQLKKQKQEYQQIRKRNPKLLHQQLITETEQEIQYRQQAIQKETQKLQKYQQHLTKIEKTIPPSILKKHPKIYTLKK